MAKSTSLLRPNRDYNQSIQWNYDLNKQLYDAYVESEPKRFGFMQRLKRMWNINHPVLDLGPKHLNESAKRIIKCKFIHITESSESTQTNNLPVNKTPNSDTRYNNNFNVYVQ